MHKDTQYTRCPQCQTAFKVTDKMLSMAQGKVRCGACLQVFQATDYLLKLREPEKSVTTDSVQADSQPSNIDTAEDSSEVSVAPPPSESLSSDREALADESEPDIGAIEDIEPSFDELDFNESFEPTEVDENQTTAESREIKEESLNLSSPQPEVADEYSQDTSSKVITNESISTFDIPDVESAILEFPDEEPIEEFDTTDDFDELELPEDDDLGLSTFDESIKDNSEADLQDSANFTTPSKSELQDDDIEHASSVTEPRIDLGEVMNGESMSETYRETLSEEAQEASLENSSDDEATLEHNETLINEAVADEEVEQTDEYAFEEGLKSHKNEYQPDSVKSDVNQATQLEFGEDFDEPAKTVDEFLKHEAGNSAESHLLQNEPSQFDDDDFSELSDNLVDQISHTDTEPDPLDEFETRVGLKKTGLRNGVIAIVVLGLLVWLSLSFWSNRQSLAWDETWGGVTQSLCSVLPCDIQPRKDIRKIRLHQRLVTPSDEKENQLDVKILMSNEAKFEQPYPVITIKFSNSQGQQVAIKHFKPSQYFPDKQSEMMPIGGEVHIGFVIQQPHPDALGFEISFK